MKKIVRLTESDLVRLIKRVIKEQRTTNTGIEKCLSNKGITYKNLPKPCQEAITKISNGDADGIDPTDPRLAACASGLGLKAVTIIPKIVSCLEGSSEGDAPKKY